MGRSVLARVRPILAAIAAAALLTACAAEQPQSTVSRNLGSGVTSSNGGGMVPANFGTYGSQRPQP